MRVTHVITRLIVGGAQENTVATVLGLHRKGADVKLISGPTTGPEGSLEGEFGLQPSLLVLVPELILVRSDTPAPPKPVAQEGRRASRVVLPPAARASSWKTAVAEHQTPTVSGSTWQLANSVVPYLALWGLMVWSLDVSYALTLALAVPAAGFLIASSSSFMIAGTARSSDPEARTTSGAS